MEWILVSWLRQSGNFFFIRIQFFQEDIVRVNTVKAELSSPESCSRPDSGEFERVVQMNLYLSSALSCFDDGLPFAVLCRSFPGNLFKGQIKCSFGAKARFVHDLENRFFFIGQQQPAGMFDPE